MNRIYFFVLLFVVSCSANTNQKGQNSNTDTQVNQVVRKQVDTTYLRTGFYFLADDGVNKRIEKSNEIYTLSRLPFASVDNVVKARLEKTHLKDGDYTELCLTFDKKGTADIAESTGNLMHPKIAVIVTNKLLFVAENTASIKTGVMCIGLNGFSEREMEEMRKSVDDKK